MKRISLPAALILSLLIQSPGRSESVFSEHPEYCCLLPIVLPWLLVDSWWSGYKRTRTETVRIMGRDTVFLQEGLIWHDERHRTPRFGCLTAPVTISVSGQPVTIKEGTAEFHPNGMLARAKILPALIRTGSGKARHCSGETGLYPAGTLKSSEIADEDRRSLLLQGKTRDLCGPVSFHEDGSVAKALLGGDETFTVAGYPIILGRMAAIELYPSGKAAAFTSGTVNILVKDQFVKCDKASFDEQGNATWCRLDVPTAFSQSGAKLRAEEVLSLYTSGNIRRCTLSAPCRIPLKEGLLEFSEADISFFENGQLQEGPLSNTGPHYYAVDGKKLTLKEGHIVRFAENGALMYAELAAPAQFEISGGKVWIGGTARFYDSGNILSADISVPAEIPYLGKNVALELPAGGFPEHGKLWFDRQKRIIAVQNQEVQQMTVRGWKVNVPRACGVIFTDYDKKEAEAVDLYKKNIHVRDGIELNRDCCNEYIDTFVRAKRYYNEDDELHADGIEEVMFSEEATIQIDRMPKRCPAMEWIRLP